MARVLDKAREHYVSIPLAKIQTPEWGIVIYHKPLTVRDRRRVWTDAAGSPVDGFRATARAIMFLALDAAGKRLFDDMDEHALLHEVDSEVVSRVGGTILGLVSGVHKTDEEQVEDAKNV